MRHQVRQRFHRVTPPFGLRRRVNRTTPEACRKPGFRGYPASVTLRRESPYRGRRVGLVEALTERVLISPLGFAYTLKVAPRLDRFVIPRTHGRLSSLGRNRVGLLTTTGAKSGQLRTQPVALIDVGDGLLATGSNYGRPSHPSWSANLIAHPECEVEFRGPRKRYQARLLGGDERAGAWDTITDWSVNFLHYEKPPAHVRSASSN